MDISEQALAPLFGYSSLEKYYDDTQAVGRIHMIKVPTLFLNSIDDPTINPELYPYKEFENNDYVMAAFTLRGGHCGHFMGGLKPRQWFPLIYLEFLDHLERTSRLARENSVQPQRQPLGMEKKLGNASPPQ